MRNPAVTGLLLLVLVTGSAGCDGVRQASPTAPSTFQQQTPGSSGAVPTSHTVPAADNGVAGFYKFDVSMWRSGTATVTLRWPNGDFSLQMYVTNGACTDTASLLTGACAILGKTRPGELPGVVTSTVTGGDLNTIWVLNSDPAPQGFAIIVDIE
jgi:hypothetical protein